MTMTCTGPRSVFDGDAATGRAIAQADVKHDCLWNTLKPKPEYFPATVNGMFLVLEPGGLPKVTMFCCGMKGGYDGLFGGWDVQFTTNARASARPGRSAAPARRRSVGRARSR
jgi:hypothetical protein